MKLKRRFTINTLAVLIVGLAAFMGFWMIYGKAVFDEQQFLHLTSVREEKSRQIESFFSELENEVTLLSKTPCVIQATADFSRTFKDINRYPFSEFVNKDDTLKLKNYYLNEFLPKLNKSKGKKYTFSEFELTSNTSKILQHFYIAENKNNIQQKDLLIELNNVDLEYDVFHKNIHLYFREVTKRFGYYDLFLVNLDGDVVYSVFKETDFATNLLYGPYAKSGLAEVFKTIRKTGQTALVDFKNYAPSYGSPASFMGTPIRQQNKTIGYLIIQVPIDEIELITTGNYQWEEDGLGNSGETLIVGEDYMARSNCRFFIEDTASYLLQMKDVITASDIDQIKHTKKSILVHPIKTKVVDKALNGETGFEIIKDYKGVDVFSSYAPLKINGVNWVIVSQIDKEEARYGLIRSYEYAICIFFILTLVLYLSTRYLADSLSKPIVLLNNYLTKYTGGKKTTSHQFENSLDLNKFKHRNDEVGELGKSFLRMQDQLNKTFDELEKSLSEKNIANKNLENTVALLEESTTELQKSMNLISLIIKNSADAIITIDPDLHITQFNPAAENIFGYRQEEILGKSINILLPKEHRGSHEEKIHQFGKSNITFKRMADRIVEVSGIRKDGTAFPAEVGISKLMVENQLIFTAFLRDISDRKALEKRLLKTEKLASLGVLTAGVAHEINNPLNYIHGAYTAITNQLKDGQLTDENFKKYLDWISVGVQRITKIVKSLNKFTISSFVGDEICDLQKIVSACLAEYKNELGEHIEIRTTLTEKEIKVHCNYQNLKEVLLSLLSNAKDALRDKEEGLISITTESSDKEIILTVEDNGCGIPKENVNKVFDPFFTTKAPSKGTGLGLSIVHAIIEEHQGKITIESEEGKGTKVTVTLTKV